MAEGKKQIKITGQQLLDTYKGDQAKLEALQGRWQSLQQILMEMTAAKDSVKEIARAKDGENILVSLGAGVFAEAKIANTKKVKTSLAGSVLVDEGTEKAETGLEKEMEKVKKDLAQVHAEMQKIQENMQGITDILKRGQRQPLESGKTEVSSVS
jgi:prefoldin alpha subunit